MEKISVVGLDLAKSVFQVHGADDAGNPILRRKLRRGDVIKFFTALPPCLVAMEACGSSHHWGRVIQGLGHEVRLLPPAYVKPYVKRGKTDAADAEAIAEAVTRPTMRQVPIKSEEQQAILMVHKSRELLVRQRTMLRNQIRAFLGELGLIGPTGGKGFASLMETYHQAQEDLPEDCRALLPVLLKQLDGLEKAILALEKRILAWHRSNKLSQALATIPGVGPIGASLMVALISNPGQFRTGRHLAAWLGLTPRVHSSGGKESLRGISKQGNPMARKTLILGAMACIRQEKIAQKMGEAKLPWLARLLERKPAKVAAVAFANKMARIIWAMMVNKTPYLAPVVE